MTVRVGIDFGTANTVVATWDQALQRGEPVPLEGLDLQRKGARGVHQRVIPSLIAYPHDGGVPLVGAQVLARDASGDEAFEVFRSTKSNVTGRSIDIPRLIGPRRISGKEAATRFLTDVMAAAALAVGRDDLEIVATAPVEAFDTYRDWLVREVGAEIDLARLRVVDEATAAAVGYSAKLNPGETFLVIDFGAGTLDISAVRVQDPTQAVTGSGVRAIAKTGLDLGGNHIDAFVAEYIADQWHIPLGDTATYKRLFGRLLRATETAKVALTESEHVSVAVEFTDGESPTIRNFDLSRQKFTGLLRDKDILGRFNRALRKVLDSATAAGHPAGSFSAVFLVGGTCLIPAIQDLVKLTFDPSIVACERPLEAVAAGAAGIAGGYELHDHIQHDYAIRHVNRDTGVYEFETVVTAGTEYPTPEPIKTFTVKAIRDGQKSLGLAIYELAHATYRESSSELEIVFDAQGGAHTVPVTPQYRQERSRLWLNEGSPTFLEAKPPAQAGKERFRLDFRVDAQKRLTVSAFDLERRIWVLDDQPVVRLS